MFLFFCFLLNDYECFESSLFACAALSAVALAKAEGLARQRADVEATTIPPPSPATRALLRTPAAGTRNPKGHAQPFLDVPCTAEHTRHARQRQSKTKRAGTPKDAGLSEQCLSVYFRYQLIRETNWMTRAVFVPVRPPTR